MIDAMDNYTMTFYCRDCLVISPDTRMRQRQVQRQVLERMEDHKLELVDFNLTENYHTYPGYNNRAGNHKTLVEIRLDLTRFDLKSRDAIYNRCLNALQHGELFLSDVDENQGEPPAILIFDMKDHAQAS